MFECTEIIQPADFMRAEHGNIWAAILALGESADPRVDALTVGEELRRREQLELCGGFEYLNQLVAEHGAAIQGAETYARLVRDKARLRALHDAGSKIAALGWDNSQDPEDAESEAMRLLVGLAEREAQADIGPTAAEWVEEEQFSAEAHEPPARVQIPWDILNRSVLLAPGDVTTLGGLTSHGKTALMLNLAWGNATQGRRVYLWSGEMNKRQIYARLVALAAHIPLGDIIRRNLTAAQWEQAKGIAAKIDASPLIIRDKRGLYLRDIEADLRLAERRDGSVDLVLIDYLQILGDLNAEVEDDTRRDVRVGRCVWRSTLMAERLHCHVMLGSQFNGQPNSRFVSRPRISDMRDSRQIEQHSPNVWLIYRPERDENLTNEEKQRQANMAEIIIGKQRQGQVGSVWLYFQGETQSFLSLPRDQWPENQSNGGGKAKRK